MGKSFEEMQEIISQSATAKRKELKDMLKELFDENSYCHGEDEDDEEAGDEITDDVVENIVRIKPAKIPAYLKELAPSGQLLPTDIFDELLADVLELKKDLDYLERLKFNAREHKQETPES